MSASESTRADQRSVPVLIRFPKGERRWGFYDEWRSLVVWREACGDLDEFGEPEKWDWRHAHINQVDVSPLVTDDMAKAALLTIARHDWPDSMSGRDALAQVYTVLRAAFDTGFRHGVFAHALIEESS